MGGALICDAGEGVAVVVAVGSGGVVDVGRAFVDGAPGLL